MTLHDGFEFWRGRRVLLTGHTGFKGSWLHLWLRCLGADVTGYALAPDREPNLWSLTGEPQDSHFGDVRDANRVRDVVAQCDPHIVLHMAAQALVRQSYLDPLGTFATNVLGTVHLLEACRRARSLQCIVVVTSDKVYQNDGLGRPFREGDRLGGHDPYSASKACSELAAASFRHSFFESGPPLATARAGNVIGGGDWCSDRLIPDCVRALAAGEPVHLRYPESVRPWQHVLEPLSGYLALARALAQSPSTAPRTVNFGPDPASFRTVREVVDAFGLHFDARPGWRHDPGPQPKEAEALTLSSALAAQALDWRPRLGFAESLAWTADWYRAFGEGEDMLAITRAQLLRYQELP